MSRSRFLVLAVVALTLSVAVTYLTYRVLSEGAAVPDEFTNVVVATADIPLGARLAPEDLRLAPWPVALSVEGHLEEADMASIIGRGTIYPIYANEPILESKLAPQGSGAGLAPTIPEGMRAMSVRVNEIIGVAGFILPGSRVDVIITGTPQGGGGQELAKAFLENVTVQSVGQDLQPSASGEPRTVQTVTLLVSPEDAQALALAQNSGSIRLSLRNPMDMELPDPEATPQPRLFQQRNEVSATSRPPAPPSAAPVVRAAAVPPPPPPTPPPPRPEPWDVELIQGGSSQTFTFEVDPE